MDWIGRKKLLKRIGLVLCLGAAVAGCHSGPASQGQQPPSSLQGSVRKSSGAGSQVELLSPHVLAAANPRPDVWRRRFSRQ